MTTTPWRPDSVSGTSPSVCDAAEIAVVASFLPGNMHRDPADPLLVATARHLGMPIVTRDAKIIAYAAQGFVRVLPC